ncbi:MAG: sigma factor-like helix-turn-helix DNA-binding protein, partial [Armatimonadota bacterium]
LNLSSLRDSAQFPAWLYAIARNAASREACKDPDTEDLEAVVLALSMSLSDKHWRGVHDQLECGPVVQALRALPEHLELPARLVYLQSWSVKEAAEFLGLPLTTVKWRLHEARCALRDRFPDLTEQSS